jgi:hypothetical protein
VKLSEGGLALFEKNAVLITELGKTTAAIASVVTNYRCGKWGTRHPG